MKGFILGFALAFVATVSAQEKPKTTPSSMPPVVAARLENNGLKQQLINVQCAQGMKGLQEEEASILGEYKISQTDYRGGVVRVDFKSGAITRPEPKKK